jgi:hypothetical protein
MRAVAVALVAGTIGVTSVLAQPGGADVDRAKDLYKAAEQAVSENRFADAARDYGAAYDITKDPVLFYKIASANERAGKCEIALIYYGRYVREARPNEQFLALVRERIVACGGDPRRIAGDAPDATGSAEPAGSGSAPPPVPEPTPDPQPEPLDPLADPGAGSGSAAAPVVAPRHRVAWLLVGGSIASLTLGAVLAYSADAAERDVSDLYVGLGGVPPQFNPAIKQRFDDLVAEGKRYEKLSWASFGIAGALAIGAAIRFATAKPAEQTVITPTVTPKGAGVSATWRF